MRQSLGVGSVATTTDSQMTLPATVFLGGVQDACHDACSICLESFCENDPSTMTSCRHEYHLQCIMEWSQRSKECPICWQPFFLDDAYSQSVLISSKQDDLVSQQRSTPFCPPQVQDDEWQRFETSYGDNSDVEHGLEQHRAAVARGRAQQHSRESFEFRPSLVQGQSHSMNPRTCASHFGNRNVSAMGTKSPATSISVADEVGLGGTCDQDGHISVAFDGPSAPRHRARNTDGRSMESYSQKQDALGHVGESLNGSSSSGLSFSEILKSRLAATSLRYRESLTKTSKGLRERLHVYNSPIAEWGARARDVSAGVVRALERLSLEFSEKTKYNSMDPNSSAGSDSQGRTELFLSGGCEGRKCSSSTLRRKECGVTVTASSSTESHPDKFIVGQKLDNIP